MHYTRHFFLAVFRPAHCRLHILLSLLSISGLDRIQPSLAINSAFLFLSSSLRCCSAFFSWITFKSCAFIVRNVTSHTYRIYMKYFDCPLHRYLQCRDLPTALIDCSFTRKQRRTTAAHIAETNILSNTHNRTNGTFDFFKEIKIILQTKYSLIM